MISIAKIIYEYCRMCKFRWRTFYEEPCAECLHNLGNSDYRKPIKFEEEK